jgi:hypothetical protein
MLFSKAPADVGQWRRTSTTSTMRSDSYQRPDRSPFAQVEHWTRVDCSRVYGILDVTKATSGPFSTPMLHDLEPTSSTVEETPEGGGDDDVLDAVDPIVDTDAWFLCSERNSGASRWAG